MMVLACARPLVGVLVFAVLATAAQAQSLEIYAGGKRFNDSPALETPVWPGGITLGPDGRFYVVSRMDDSLLRLDAANGTATVLPALSGHSPFRYLWDVAYGANGTLYAMQSNRVVKLNLETGEEELLAGSLDGGGLPRNCYSSGWNPPSYSSQSSITTSPNGDVYVVDASAHWICVITPGGFSSRAVGAGGWGGFGGDGGPAEYAELNWPRAIATDAAGNLYISDTGNNRIRKVSAEDGIITTIAGTGSSFGGGGGGDGDGGPAVMAIVGNPGALALDAAANVFYWDSSARRVRRIDGLTGIISTVAGNGEWGYSGDGGPATQQSLSEVSGIVVAANGDLYLSDQENKRVRRVAFDTGIISTVLGNGENSFCGEGATRLETCLNFPQGVIVNASGDMYISDAGNLRIRKLSGVTGLLDTIAGRSGFDPTSGDGGPASAATFGNTPAGLALDAAGNLYLAGWWDHRIRRIDAASGIITTIAGTGVAGSAGDGGPATSAQLNLPDQLAIDAAGNIYVSEGNGNRVRRIAAATGVISTVAGTGLGSGPLGDGGPAAMAAISNPSALGFDAMGNLLISDTGHARLRKLDPNTGIITTVAGNGSAGNAGNGGPATAAELGWVTALATDAGGNIFLAAGSTMRRIEAATGIIDSVPTGWVGLATPDGVTMGSPTQMAFDAQGRLYVADSDYGVVWQVVGLPPVAVPDTTAPVIEAAVTGTAGNNGWYRSDVQLTWTVNDAESAISSSSGCSTTSVSSDTVGITFTCTATSEGGTATQSVTVKRDATPPTLAFGALTPAPNAGWNNSSVSIPFTPVDATAGVKVVSLPSPLVFNADGEGLFQQVLVTDFAGNVANFESPHVNIDRSPPIVTPVVTGILGNNGWYRSDVQLQWSINDAPISVVGCGSQTVAADTAGVTLSCSATSAGGTTSASITLKRDATPPVLSFGAATPAANTNGWNKTNVSIPFTRSDALSGIASTSVASPLVVSVEGASVTGQVIATDNAGNSATFTSVARNIDKTAPVVTVTSPANGATYGFYQDVIADFSCTDVSLQSCIGTTATGVAVNTKTAGAKTFKVTGKDLVSFTTAVTNSFSVDSSFNWVGFTAPANTPQINRVARNTRVPIRWQLPDGRGGFVSNTAAYKSITTQTWSCGNASSVPYAETTSAPVGISFDPSTSSFVYNWNTGTAAACRTVIIELRDGSPHEIYFKIQ